jgi:predicted aspartyl protease
MSWRCGVVAIFLMAATGAMANPDAYQPYRIAYQSRLVTDVFLNGQGPFTFLIDTASTHSIIYEHVREKLKLTRSSPEPLVVFGINAVSEAVPVKPDTLDVAGETIRGLTMGVLPDTEQGKDPDGVLGIDVLSRYFVVLDRARMQMKLLAPGTVKADDYADWVSAPLEPHPLKNIPADFWYLPVTFNGQTLTSLFDLGSGVTLFNWEAASRLGYDRRDFVKLGPPPEKLRDILGKTAPVVVLTGMEVHVGARVWTQRDALVSDAPVFEFFGLEEKTGVIVGPGLLRDNSLAIDFAGHRLYVGPKVYR